MKNEMKEFKGWEVRDKNKFIPQVYDFQEVISPGIYHPMYNSAFGFFLEKSELNIQDLFNFPGSVAEQVIKDIDNFWRREELFAQYQFPYKRGILLFGPPGGGKSSVISLICRDVVQNNGIVLIFNDYNTSNENLKLLKKVHPDIKIVVLMEDLDEILANESISCILNLLDGVESCYNRIVFLATTNHPEKLQENIKNRPSRFDRKFEFKTPDIKVRYDYLKTLFKKTEHSFDLNCWAEDTSGLSFAHLKELFVSVVLFGNPYEESLKILRQMGNDSAELLP